MADFSIFAVDDVPVVKLEQVNKEEPTRGYLSLIIDTEKKGMHDVTLFASDIIEVANALNRELTLAIAKVEIAMREEAEADG